MTQSEAEMLQGKIKNAKNYMASILSDNIYQYISINIFIFLNKKYHITKKYS